MLKGVHLQYCRDRYTHVHFKECPTGEGSMNVDVPLQIINKKQWSV